MSYMEDVKTILQTLGITLSPEVWLSMSEREREGIMTGLDAIEKVLKELSQTFSDAFYEKPTTRGLYVLPKAEDCKLSHDPIPPKNNFPNLKECKFVMDLD